MQINNITYHDHYLEWRYENIYFSNLNLLVGVSGVGKTQILNSIMNLKKIAKGDSLNGLEWDVIFTSDNHLYRWSGEFEKKTDNEFIFETEDSNEIASKRKYKLNREFLYKNNKTIIERHQNRITFKGQELPKLSPFESSIAILGEEDDILPVREGFNKVFYSNKLNQNPSSNDIFEFIVNKDLFVNKCSSLVEIQESSLSIALKLALIYDLNLEIFNEIKNSFMNIFSQVEDIKLEADNDNAHKAKFSGFPIIKIKEKGVSNWITQERISSGMLRTLIHISELYLSAEGTVILIDEFENSLGINCIDILSNLLSEKRQLQFIITSHHPYIINNISMEHWKIVTRKGGVVTARNAQDFNLGQSRHQAFMQLINLDEYREGITA
ncbi:AAA family ATPase [Anabaena azotica]|uniref:ATP-binding protein n=1 Tax=Anabaena azotica FACHB-119 TaxID=947527 RepID=A0ABR8D160_9NOST|nr:AAA family ATPase [Anabaena azotica]MBD2500883.1 ATP-binding protein [Anabaena azotica FACHB-119]